MVFNSSINIILYCVFNSQFRVEATKAMVQMCDFCQCRRANGVDGGGEVGGLGHRNLAKSDFRSTVARNANCEAVTKVTSQPKVKM